MSENTYLTEIELFERWDKKVALKTLQNWRAGKRNNGPAYRKFGQRVLYPLDKVVEYEESALNESALLAPLDSQRSSEQGVAA